MSSMQLPTQYNAKYTQCRKENRTGRNCYKMYWIGTSNEIFPGMLFFSPSIARDYLKHRIASQQSGNEDRTE